MSLLTDQDILDVGHSLPQDRPLNLFDYARAIEAAVIRKLATVSVEPVAWGVYAKVEDGCWHLQHPVRFFKEDADADHAMYERTTQLRTEPLYPQEALAAARVQALEEAAKISPNGLDIRASTPPAEVWTKYQDAIRGIDWRQR